MVCRLKPKEFAEKGIDECEGKEYGVFSMNVSPTYIHCMEFDFFRANLAWPDF